LTVVVSLWQFQQGNVGHASSNPINKREIILSEMPCGGPVTAFCLNYQSVVISEI
jgi:hypothetical protein